MTKEEIILGLKSVNAECGRHFNEGGAWMAEFIDEAIKALEQQPCEDKGEISDGYHTFNQLYHQRAILFATIVNQNPTISWKSYKHSDGNYCFDSNGEWFIVGIDTPEGSYTYHYAKDYWDYFKCKELECGKSWDGHTEEDVTRLLSLEQQTAEDCVRIADVYDLVTKLFTSIEMTNEEYKCAMMLVKELPSCINLSNQCQKVLEEFIRKSPCDNCMDSVALVGKIRELTDLEESDNE